MEQATILSSHPPAAAQGPADRFDCLLRLFLGFSIFWMGGASGILDLDDGAIHIPPPGGWAASTFGLFGLPFAVIGICGIGGALLRMLPNSPYAHIEINADGLLVRSLFKQTRHAWRDLPGVRDARAQAADQERDPHQLVRGGDGRRAAGAGHGARRQPSARGAAHRCRRLRREQRRAGCRRPRGVAQPAARAGARQAVVAERNRCEVPEGFRRQCDSRDRLRIRIGPAHDHRRSFAARVCAGTRLRHPPPASRR